MGYARNCAKWRNIQKDQDPNKPAFYLLLFLAGFISWGATWLLGTCFLIYDILYSFQIEMDRNYQNRFDSDPRR